MTNLQTASYIYHIYLDTPIYKGTNISFDTFSIQDLYKSEIQLLPSFSSILTEFLIFHHIKINGIKTI